MPTLTDMLDAARSLKRAVQALNNMLEDNIIQFDEQAFHRHVLEQAKIPKLQLTRAVDAKRFLAMHEHLFLRIRALKLGRITRAELTELEEIAAQMSVIVHSAVYPVWNMDGILQDVEDPDNTE